MEERINLNVSATNYDQASKEISTILTMLEEMVHEEECFVISDSEFAFGWHFFVVSVNRILVQKLATQMGQDFQKLKGKGVDKKFLTWITKEIKHKKNKAKKHQGKRNCYQRRNGIRQIRDFLGLENFPQIVKLVCSDALKCLGMNLI